MRVRHIRQLLPGLILLLALGCGGDSSTPTSPGSPDVADATLSVASAVSLGRVDVAGLNPPSAKKAQDFRVVVTAAGAEESTLILDYDDDGWFFRAPLHPVTPNAGGSVQIRITDGSDSSAPQDLELTALPSAPGSFAALVATMREHLEQRAGWAGTSIDSLKAMPADNVPPALLPLKISQEYLDSDADENDLTDLAANTNGFLSADEVDQLDRFFGSFQLAALLQQEIADGNALDEVPMLAQTPAPAPPRAPHHPAPTSATACFFAGPEIDSAPYLAIYMTRSAVAQFGADPNSDAGRILAFGAAGLSIMGTAPGPLGKVVSVSAAVIAAVQGATEAVAGIMPSRFTSIAYQLDQNVFNEDELGYATYSNVEVVAASTGWTADRSLSNALINTLGAYMSLTDMAQIRESTLARDVTLQWVGIGAGEVFGESDLIEICPQDWTVDISSPLYCTASSLQHKFEVDVEAQHVTPKAAGSDQLRVAAQATQFGGRTIHADADMRVRTIQVPVTPDEIYVTELGQTVTITAGIVNADLETLRWTPAWGSWDDNLSDETNGPRTRPLVTPTNADAYPFVVTIESLSRQGARASGLPPRVGFATIHNGAVRDIRISPSDTCIHNGETVQFTPQVRGFAEGEYHVTWAIAEGWGTIDQNGLYHAPNGGSTNDIITATIDEDSTIFDAATVDVGNCTCNLDINISGAYVWEHGSSQAAFTVNDFGGYFYQFFFGLDLNGPPLISASLSGLEGQPAPGPGETGSWRVSFAFATYDQSWTTAPTDEDAGVTLTITELTTTTMVGHFNGTAVMRDQNGDVTSTVYVDVAMRAGLWDQGWPCD